VTHVTGAKKLFEAIFAQIGQRRRLVVRAQERRRTHDRHQDPLRPERLGCGLFLWLNELATRLHFAKHAVRGKAVDVAKLAYRRRIDSRITD
jgi:hypothetical protein